MSSGHKCVVILCSGDREWKAFDPIWRALGPYKRSGALVVHGDCRGADRRCGRVAELLGIDVRAEPADWKTYGKAAGVIRNQVMLDRYQPTVVYAFHDSLETSRGTKDMIARALKARLPVLLWMSDGSRRRVIAQ